MLIWNIYDQNRLYNNIRLVITQLHSYCIKAQIFGDEFDSQPQVLFYALFIINKKDFFFLLIQKQFLIYIYFAITINKF